MSKLDALIKPKSIALIGASENQDKIGFQILNNLIEGGFSGQLYPVNPKGGEILGKKVYTSVKEIAEVPDLAVIVIPGSFVIGAAKEVAEKGIKALIVISAGFAEIDEKGAALQTELADLCRENGISLLGPNCLGFLNANDRINASFAKDMPKMGKVSLLSQSGAVISSMIDWSKSAPIGFSKIFSLGNKALLTEAELLEYLYNDPETTVIIGYIENLVVSESLTEVLTKYSKTKPTILLFGGKSSVGAIAARSHTGSVVSSYLTIKTYLEQAGVILANNLEELLLFAQIFCSYQQIDGDRIALVTNAGGPSIAAVDALSQIGLKLAALSDETQSELKKVLKAEASVKNPVDILGDADENGYLQAISIVEKDPNTDGIIVLLTPQSSTKITETAEVIANFQSKKPIISSFVGGEILVGAKKIIEGAQKPCFSFPEEAVDAVHGLVKFATGKVSLGKNATATESYDTEKLDESLEKFSLPSVQYITTETLEETIAAGNKIGFPLVLKTANPNIVHKTESSAVTLNINTEAALTEAYEKTPKPVIVGKMVKGKHEIFLGVKKDAGVGTIIAFGTGGIYAEIYKDLSYRITPINTEMALEMIHETKMGEILGGARGQKAYDFDKLAEIIVNMSKFADNYKNISEIDFNPLIADAENFYVVDARIILD